MKHFEFTNKLINLVARSNALSNSLQDALVKGDEITPEVVLALSNYKACEKDFENILDLLLHTGVTLN